MMNRELYLFSQWITNNPLLRGRITSSHKHSLILAVSPLLLFCTPLSSKRIFLSNSHKTYSGQTVQPQSNTIKTVEPNCHLRYGRQRVCGDST